MSEAKHSTGPWTAIDRLDGRLQFPVKGPDGFPVCGVDHREGVFSGYGGSKDAMSRRPEGQSEAWANARLIAAAPELLDALQTLHGSIPSKYEALREIARSAIAKATGGAA